MRSTDNALPHVVERFPDQCGRIRRLADSDKKFGDLCLDYADAVELHRYWQARGGSQATQRARDYATVVAELEAEISRELRASHPPKSEE